MHVMSYAFFQSPTPVYWRNDRTQDRMSAYARFLPALVRAHRALWSGYELRIYHDDAVRDVPYFKALEAMHDRGALRLMPCGEARALTLAMLWRMRPLFDENDHLVVTCDIDAFPLLRLRKTVEEFTASRKAVMVVHGCESHNGVLGGGFGARGGRFRSLVGAGTWDAFIALGDGAWDAYAADEEFLRKKIWPLVTADAVLFSDNDRLNITVHDQRKTIPRPVPGDVVPDAATRADDFAPYIGSAGYDVVSAFKFFDPLSTSDAVRECEHVTNVDPLATIGA